MKKLILSSLFVLISIVSFSQGFYNRWVPTSGTDTYTTNITSFTSLSNSVIYVKFTNTNTTAATITINGTLGPAPIRAWDGDSWEVLSGGELDVNTIYKLSYQGSYYELEGIGSGSSLFPTTGTGTATGNVTGDLDGNQLQIINTDYVNIQSGVSQVEFNNSTFAILNDGSQIVLEDATGLDLRTGTGNSRLLIEPDGSFNLAGDNGTSGQVLTSAGSGAAPTWEDPASVSLGTEGQIPVMNSTDDDFVYSDKFKWDDTDNNFIAGNGTTSGGTNNINFGDATTLTGSWSLTSAEESTVRGNNNTSSGWDVTVGDNTNANSGNGTTTSGIDNINYGIGSYVGGIGAQLSYVSTSQRGGFVHAFSAGSVDGKKPSGVEYLISNDGAFNVSRNTANQTAGHGSLAQDGAILGGINHNIPSSSPRSVIIGGDSIKARGSDPDNVYVPYLNVTQSDQNDTLTQVMARDRDTKQVFWRHANTFWDAKSGATLTGPNTITGTTSNWVKLRFDNLGSANQSSTNGAGLWLHNTTASTNGSPQRSPGVIWEGSAFATTPATSQSAKWIATAIGVQQATTVASTWSLSVSVNGSSYTDRFSVTSSGRVTASDFFSGTTNSFICGSTNQVLDTNGSGTIRVRSVLGSTSGLVGARIYSTTGTATSGNQINVAVGDATAGFAPTSGTATYTHLSVEPVINQTGGANGAVTGIDYNPTVTSVLGTHTGLRIRAGNASIDNGNITLGTAGNGILIKTGSNATAGTATLTAGSVTVSTTKVTANSIIMLTSQSDGGTPGFVRVSSRSASTSFTITSSSGTDTSVIGWVIIEPAP